MLPNIIQYDRNITVTKILLFSGKNDIGSNKHGTKEIPLAGLS